MNASKPGVVTLANKSAFLWIDSFGGAITSFQLNGSGINPLDFSFTKDQMPVNNQAGAPYQGHFACIGRWGEPSAGEIAAGVPNHGEPANIDWKMEQQTATKLAMHTRAEKEGLDISRTITMDPVHPVFSVEETITNFNTLGRVYNIVQHPTLAAPFLDDLTVVNCNAEKGFEQGSYQHAEANTIQWPGGDELDAHHHKMETAGGGENGVHSFIVKPGEKYGWITAFSPAKQLLIGYIWPRVDYPWIHLWRHYHHNNIQYLGIEFGTAGIHQPFEKILDAATKLFGEKTYAFLDAGQGTIKRYSAFTFSTGDDFRGVANVHLSNNALVIQPKGGSGEIIFQLTKS